MALTDNIAVTLPPDHALDMQAVSTVTTWLQERMESLGIKLRAKSKVLLPNGVGINDLGTSQGSTPESTGLMISQGGLNVVSVLIGTERFQRQPASQAMCGDPAELLQALAEIEDS